MYWQELTDLKKRQYVDAESVFIAVRDAEMAANAIRGSMLWRQVSCMIHLIRTKIDNSRK